MGYLRRSLFIFIVCFGAAGCVCGGKVLAAKQATQIYERVTNQFAAAMFFKPADATNVGLASQFAPLIIQEVPDKQGSAAALRDAFGPSASVRDIPDSLFVIRHSSLSSPPGASNSVSGADLSQPAVFSAADSVQLNGHAHARLSYQWCYLPSHPAGAPPALPRQGIRITLDSRGQPAVWEVLADTSGLRLIFVSQSLEAGAVAELGKPMAGRRFAVERSLDQATGVVVPCVIDDGPMAMGPIVYLSEGTRDVSTLICRCMPAQVKQLIATRTFDLIPLEGALLNVFLATAGTASNAPPLLWPTDSSVENGLDHCLRLPAGF
jgi:hypothetical protein